MRAKPKPQTALAKADAAITREHRAAYSEYDADVVRYGQRVADHNAGFSVGWEDGRRSVRDAAKARKRR